MFTLCSYLTVILFLSVEENWFFQSQIKINFFIIASVPKGIGALLIFMYFSLPKMPDRIFFPRPGIPSEYLSFF